MIKSQQLQQASTPGPTFATWKREVTEPPSRALGDEMRCCMKSTQSRGSGRPADGFFATAINKGQKEALSPVGARPPCRAALLGTNGWHLPPSWWWWWWICCGSQALLSRVSPAPGGVPWPARPWGTRGKARVLAAGSLPALRAMDSWLAPYGRLLTQLCSPVQQTFPEHRSFVRKGRDKDKFKPVPACQETTERLGNNIRAMR